MTYVNPTSSSPALGQERTEERDRGRGLLLLLPLVLLALTAWTPRAQADSQPLKQQLEEAVQAALPWKGATVEVGKIRVVGKMPAGDYRLELDERRLRRRVRARLVSSENARGAWVQAPVTIEVPVLVADADIDADAAVGSMVRVETKELKGLPHGFVTDADELAHKIARRRIKAGQVITSSLLEEPVAVERNQIVTILVRRGAVKITDRGVALQSGKRGDTVRVRSASSNAVVNAIARSNALVEVP
jgi:flagella basal body P-ring formation protein FlgA